MYYKRTVGCILIYCWSGYCILRHCVYDFIINIYCDRAVNRNVAGRLRQATWQMSFRFNACYAAAAAAAAATASRRCAAWMWLMHRPTDWARTSRRHASQQWTLLSLLHRRINRWLTFFLPAFNCFWHHGIGADPGYESEWVSLKPLNVAVFSFTVITHIVWRNVFFQSRPLDSWLGRTWLLTTWCWRWRRCSPWR